MPRTGRLTPAVRQANYDSNLKRRRLYAGGLLRLTYKRIARTIKESAAFIVMSSSLKSLIIATLRNLFRFVAVGSCFATVEEFLTIVVLRRDIASYVMTLLLLFPAWLTFVYFSCKLLDRMFQSEPAREAAHFFAFGWLGLMIEWFVMRLSPWSNPDANPLLMAGFQIGMFAFWSTVSTVPRLFRGTESRHRTIRKQILWFYVPYFIFVYVAGLSVRGELQWAVIISAIVLGYVTVNLLIVNYLVRAFRAARVHGQENCNVQSLPDSAPADCSIGRDR